MVPSECNPSDYGMSAQEALELAEDQNYRRRALCYDFANEGRGCVWSMTESNLGRSFTEATWYFYQ